MTDAVVERGGLYTHVICDVTRASDLAVALGPHADRVPVLAHNAHHPLMSPVAHVVLDGLIDEAQPDRRFGPASSPRMEVDAIAYAYLQLVRQHPSAWTHELWICARPRNASEAELFPLSGSVADERGE